MKMTYAAQLYIEEKSKRLRKNTISGYISSLRKYVVPRFGEIEIEDISFDDVQEWVDDIEKSVRPRKPSKPSGRCIATHSGTFRFRYMTRPRESSFRTCR